MNCFSIICSPTLNPDRGMGLKFLTFAIQSLLPNRDDGLVVSAHNRPMKVIPEEHEKPKCGFKL